ncbi:helix-turn-helix domain-containing protein [Paenibacillus sp. IHBB 3054]|uniref:helix-turn-helix domain-containing protein n=1 Tax=Paenibacillus sp. IHBB 3054 TaxID=3425689 RepID=UPI003F66991F
MNQPKPTLAIINHQEAYELLFQNYPDVVNIAEMCEMLGGISNKTAYKLLQENTINHFKIGRIYKIPKVNILLYLNLFSFTFDRLTLTL